MTVLLEPTPSPEGKAAAPSAAHARAPASQPSCCSCWSLSLPSSPWSPSWDSHHTHQRSCIPASRVCDGVRTCAHGEDEDETMCRDMPQSLPSFLVARCGDPSFWIYSDQKCDGTNNCGDCSDELSPVTTCPPCGPGWWRCPSTVFGYCGCIPRSLCRDHTQHCSDWSDEYSCPGP
ncbi:low-density lipoprotein receptor class A domain-containing protein 1 isoform X3 [Mustela lutreola]|uniref:Low-density lipoprotein receptor class A domain-containing protein 1 isoform X2 n=1 Tax=Mustela putorius furo TaxID=9669 RepID=A0A8U0TCQ9_MUSPF|nr:low-density lipoprotein receptor class A domain-containing protein 1 isoform X2 [Mustela putorius furo]XP_058993168.1 low-density lipoprotein receptor class A domain-containing protein 1 isoform X3 [Mustela lutreola]